MTNRQLNAKIKKLGSDYWDLTFMPKNDDYRKAFNTLRDRFLDLVSASSDCIGLSVSSLLIMIRLNQALNAYYGINSDFGQFVKLQKFI